MHFEDGMRGSSGDALGSHSATNIASPYASNGGTWTVISGTWTLVGSSTDGYVQQTSTPGKATCSLVPASLDYNCQAIVSIPASARGHAGVAVRLSSDGQSAYAAYYDAAFQQWTLSAVIIGNEHILATWKPPSPYGIETHTVKLACSGYSPTLLTVTIDGAATPQISFTDSTYQVAAINRPGLWITTDYNGAGPNLTLGSFQADDAGSVAGVGVSIFPTAVTLYTQATQLFTATVANATNQAVTWSCDSGTINANGLYTAPTTAGTYHVTATSVADNTKSATAVVTVIACNPYTLTGTKITEACTPVQQMAARAHRQSVLTQSILAELWYLDTSNGTWYQFPIQPNMSPAQPIEITQAYRQPSTMKCSFLDPQGYLTPENRGSPYNLNQAGGYDPLLDEARKVLLRVGIPCYPNAASGIAPTSSLAPAGGTLGMLTDGLFGDCSQNTTNYVQLATGSASPFTLTLDLGSTFVLHHAAIRFGTKVGQCSLPASVQALVSTDNVTYTAAKPARPVGGAGGDWDEDYTGQNVEVVFADLHGSGAPYRYLQFVITPTGSQTIFVDEIAVYAESGSPTLLGRNVFTGYLGDEIQANPEGAPSFLATDVLKKLQDNNEARITAQFTMQDVGDMAYSLLTGSAYWKGTGAAYDAPFPASQIGWQSGQKLTGLVFPVWQSQGHNLLGYLYELFHEVGWYFFADGNGVLQAIEPPYTQRLPDRVLIADVDGNHTVRDCVRHRTGKEIRNIWEVSSGKQKQPGGKTEVMEPNSVAKYGRRRVIITDPVATTGAIQTKICNYGIRDYAWRRNTLGNSINPDFDTRPKRIYGFRASLRPYLHSKNNGTNWDRELWSLEDLTHHLTHGRWEADADWSPYFPLGSDPPTVTSLGQTSTTVTINWAGIGDAKVASVSVYMSASANATLGIPEVQWQTFSKIGTVAVGTNTLTRSGLTSGADYWFYVTTVDTDGTESVPGTIYWARPGTATATSNDWIVSDLTASFNQVQAPANGLGYYTYEFFLQWTSPPVPAPVPDNGQGGFKRGEFRFSLGSLPANPADYNQWTLQDEWHSDRIKPGYSPLGAPAADQVAGKLQWYGRFRTTTALASGTKVYWILFTSSRTTAMRDYFPSNVAYGVV